MQDYETKDNDPITETEKPAEKPAPAESSRAKNWSERIYYIVKQETNDVVADNFKDEKACRQWIASSASEFDTQYVICYSVQSMASITKTRKIILK